MGLDKIVLTTAEVFPSEDKDVSVDLLDSDNICRATVTTLDDAKKEGNFQTPGLYKEDNVYDIIVDVPELTPEVVREAIGDLSKETGKKYELK